MKTHKILFVCLGNICRSPMAEYVLRHRAREAGMGNAVITASAGTSGWHDGEDMHEGTRRVLKQHGIDPSGFTSSKIKPFKLTDLIPDSGYNHVPDPWYTGNFDETYRLVDAGSLALLEKLKQA